MFSTPESGKISDEWTSVIILGGDDLDEAGAAFMERYGVQGYPTLLAMTAGGDVLSRDLLGGRLRDADFIFSAMMNAQKANDAFVDERDLILQTGDADGLRKLAMMNLERANPQAARKHLEQSVAKSPSAEAHQDLATVLGMVGDREAEQKVLETMIFEYPKHDRRIAWRMRRATMHVEGPTSAEDQAQSLAALIEALTTLHAEVAKEGDVKSEGAVRLEIAGLQRAAGDAEAAQLHVDWVLEHAQDSPIAIDARLFQAESALKKGETDAAREHAEAVLAQAQEGPRAVRAHMILGDIAYGDHDFDGMAKHFEAVVKLAPGTPWAREAQSVLDFLERRRKR